MERKGDGEMINLLEELNKEEGGPFVVFPSLGCTVLHYEEESEEKSAPRSV